MKVLMYGWEFPPLITGGLGVACQGIVTALSKHSEITFVLPEKSDQLQDYPNVKFIDSHAALKDSCYSLQKFSTTILHPYATSEHAWQHHLKSLGEKMGFSGLKSHYQGDLFNAVTRYAMLAGTFGKNIAHDVIHAHDWLTILAGIEAKKLSGKPLVFHVHSLEPDRSGTQMNQMVYDIEKHGLEQADRIMAVSQLTKDAIMKYYAIPSKKISVVHNGINHNDSFAHQRKENSTEKMILFIGRLTRQKGPFFFIDIAQKVLSKRQDVHFVVAGSGDMMRDMIERSAYLQIGKKIHFTGFLEQGSINRLLSIADVYVMTSVSEPFGLSCLEAISHGVPAVISKQSGVAEVMPHILKADFWDTDEMASKILSLLEYPVLHRELSQNALQQIRDISWDNTANKIQKIYAEIGAQ